MEKPRGMISGRRHIFSGKGAFASVFVALGR